jgi:hypothetical protein
VPGPPRIRPLVWILGTRFGEEGQLSIVGESDQRCPNTRGILYQVKCDTCSKDAELHGDGVFLTTITAIRKGEVPCACSKRYKWSPEQYLIRARRSAINLGIKVIHYAEHWRGAKTKVSVECLKDGHLWNKDISSIVNGSGCPVCRIKTISEFLTKTDDEAIQSFLDTRKFPEGSKFWRIPREKMGTKIRTKWKFLCGKCSKDAVAQRGQCDGVFESTQASLSRGSLPCRCPPTTYRKDLKGYLYVLMASDGQHRFVGYGISNVPIKRKATHVRNLAKDGYTIEEWTLFEGCGKLVWNTENDIMGNFETAPQKTEGFRTEATHWYNYEELLDFVESRLTLI